MAEFKLLPENAVNSKNEIGEVLAINQKTARFHLALTEKQALELLDTKKGALAANGRIELVRPSYMIDKIIMAFCDSPYIASDNYTQVIEELIECFYYYKNETADKIGDDDLLKFMKEQFDHVCHGSCQLLMGKQLEILAYCVKNNISLEDYFQEYGVEDEDEQD